jgi:hypothetical protein
MSEDKKGSKWAGFSPEIEKIIESFESAFFDIPFDNSAFQNVHFVVQQQMTPGRAYRAIGLRMSAKIRALQEAYFDRQSEEIDIAELGAKRDDPATSKFDRMRAELEIQRKLSHHSYADKLINDAIIELKTLEQELRKIPAYTREQFEAEERLHFQTRLSHQLQGLSGPAEAMIAMGQPVSNLGLIDRLQSNQEPKEIQSPLGENQK